MTIGEHLDELRAVVIRSLLAMFIVALACIWPAGHLLRIIARPLIVVLREHNQPDSLLATDPTEPLVIYIKVVFISALVIASPYILWQVWSFVAAGLYRHERRWVEKLVPFSVALFLAGVLFMYTLMLPTALGFLIGFSSWMPMPTLSLPVAPNEKTAFAKTQPASAAGNASENASLPSATTRPAGGGDAPPGTGRTPDAPAITDLLRRVPAVAADPLNAERGAIFFNESERKLKVVGAGGVYSVPFQQDGRTPLITTHIKLSEYLGFVLILTLAFGGAFQTPLVVLFLVRSGIAPIEALRRNRKIVIMAIVIIAGMIAPPDLMSHLLLSGPMILLFELGLWLAARGAKTPAGH